MNENKIRRLKWILIKYSKLILHFSPQKKKKKTQSRPFNTEDVKIFLTHLVRYFLIFPLFSNKNNIKKFLKKTKYIKNISHTRHRFQNTESYALTKRPLHGYTSSTFGQHQKKQNTFCKLKNQSLEKSEKHKHTQILKTLRKNSHKREKKEWKSHRKYCWTRWKALGFRSHKAFRLSKTSTQQPWSPPARSVSIYSTPRRRFPPLFLATPWLTSSRSVRTWPPGLRIWVLLETWASTR